MPTLEEIRTRVFRATSGMYTDSYHMDDLINDALNQLVEGARLRGVQTIDVVTGTNSYALPDDFKSPGELLYIESDNCIIPYSLVDISSNQYGYSIEGKEIIIKPVPQEERTLTHYFYKYAIRLVNNNDVPEIDSQYHDLLSFYAAGMILLLPTLNIQDKTLSDRYLNRWQDGKTNFVQDMQRKNKSSKGRTVVNW
ncbi:hypothetical protein [Paenibacillus sp. FSL R10-2734]|uniref:phage adaptor protein n=1 Tax=Paenibacillus sp. FSL R10-2734 TaxID=2954691 RepID=UPI0030D84EE6